MSLELTVAESPPKSWQERTYDTLDNISKKTIPVLEKLAGKVERHRAKQPEHRAGEPSKQHSTVPMLNAADRLNNPTPNLDSPTSTLSSKLYHAQQTPRTSDPIEPIQLLIDP